ncbi:hypothetical protein K24_09855, partial [Klebsiella pneumoniae]
MIISLKIMTGMILLKHLVWTLPVRFVMQLWHIGGCTVLKMKARLRYHLGLFLDCLGWRSNLEK